MTRNFRLTLRIALTALLIGWLAAAGIGAVIAALQYGEVARAFPGERVAVEYQVRINREIWRGSLLIFVQMGVLAGTLWWQVGTMARRAAIPVRVGGLSGCVVGAVQATAGLLLQMPILLLLVYVALLIAVGNAAGIYYQRTING
jgi:hypothetical protein